MPDVSQMGISAISSAASLPKAHAGQMGKAAAKAEKDQQKLLKEQFAANEKRLKQEEVVSKAEEASAKKSSALWTGLKASAIAAGTAFLIKNTKEALNTMKDVDSELANIRKVTGKQGKCIYNLQKAPEPLMRNGCFFWLVEAPPQSPANTEVF